MVDPQSAGREGGAPGPRTASGAHCSASRLVVADRAGRYWWLTWTEAADRVLLDTRRRRTRALARVPHPHLQEVGEVVTTAAGSAVLGELVPGTDLATLLRTGARWSPGHVVTVVVPLAEALAGLHAAGLAHGDVSPANVVVAPDGRPVLVDLLDGAGERERGTSGVAAPERRNGVVGAPGDVYALAATGAQLLAEDHAWSNPWLLTRQSTLTGSPPGTQPRDTLAGVLADAMHPDPTARPTAAGLAAAVWACATAEPLPVLPDEDLISAALRRESVERTTLARTPAPGLRRRVPRHRARSRPGRTLVGAGLLAACAAGGVALAGTGAVGPWEIPPADGSEPLGQGRARVTASAPGPDPLLAAVELTRARAEALASGDGQRLAAVTLPGSALSRADEARLEALEGVGVRPGSVSVTLREPARLLPSRLWLGEAQVLLDAVVRGDTTPGGSAEAGSVSPTIPDRQSTAAPLAEDARGVVLALVLVDGQWRVSSVQDAP